MRDWVKDILVSPSSGNKLEEQDGYLVDVTSGEAYPIRDEVPLFNCDRKDSGVATDRVFSNARRGNPLLCGYR